MPLASNLACPLSHILSDTLSSHFGNPGICRHPIPVRFLQCDRAVSVNATMSALVAVVSLFSFAGYNTHLSVVEAALMGKASELEVA